MSPVGFQTPFQDHIRLNTLPISLEDSRLANLGLEILFREKNQTTCWGLSAGWLQSLSQSLSQSFATSDSVLKCLLFLGSACESLFLPENSQQHLPLTLRHQNAIISLQKEVSTLHNGPLPVFLSSVVLAVASVLLQRLGTALTHVQGALKSLSLIRRKGKQHTTQVKNSISDSSIEYLNSIALSLDMHTGWYRLSQPPDLPRVIEITEEIPDPCTMSNLDIATFLHDAYHFAAAASHYKYCQRREIPQDLIREQSYLITVLNRIIREIVFPQPLTTLESNSNSMTQAVQCLSTLIYLSMVLQPYESAYDQFRAQFTQIVDISERLIANDHQNAAQSCLPRFQLQPGLFQPLYFTATKCRFSTIRHQAVDILDKLGIEGPWNSRIMTNVARKIIGIEEKFDVSISTGRQSEMSVSERDRIHGSGISVLPFEDCKFPAAVKIEVGRCFDIQAMILMPKEEQKPYWELWSEEIEVSNYV